MAQLHSTVLNSLGARRRKELKSGIRTLGSVSAEVVSMLLLYTAPGSSCQDLVTSEHKWYGPETRIRRVSARKVCEHVGGRNVCNTRLVVQSN
jgi:hypothetical protein